MAERLSIYIDAQNRSSPAFAALRGDMQKTEQQASKTNAILGSMGKAAAVGIAAVGVGVAAVGGIVAKTGISFLAMQQQSAIAFETILGSAEAAKAMMADLQAFAAKTPFDLPTLTNAASRLTAVGVEANRVIPIMSALGDATAAMGTGAFGIERAVTALSQMQQKGKVTGEEMLQLVEAGIPAWDALAAKLGVDVATAQERVTKGQVKVNDLFAALEERSGPAMQRLVGMMDKQSASFNGMVSTAKDTFAQFSGAVMGPLFERATEGLSKLNEQMARPEFMEWGTRVGEGLARVLDTAIRIGAEVAPLIITGLQVALDWLQTAWATGVNLATGIWDTVGPKVTTAGQAIITGLTVAYDWITSTFIPKVQELAGSAWDGIESKVGPFATTVIDKLGEVKSWVDENWPAVKETLSGVFDEIKNDAGPAIEEIKQKLSELEQKLQEINQGDGGQSFFDRLKEDVAGIDFSPLTSQFAPLLTEAQKWRDFATQDFGPAMDGLKSRFDFVRDAIGEFLPAWANLENAAKLAAAVVVSAVGEMVNIATTASALIRAALQLVVDLWAMDWPAALQTAGSALMTFANVVPGAREALNLLRIAIDLAGTAASNAARFVRSLIGSIRDIAGAALGAMNPLHGVLDVLGKIGGAKGALDFILPGSLPPLAQGMKDVGEQAQLGAGGLGRFRNALQDTGQFTSTASSTWARSTVALIDYTTQLRAAQMELRDINAELRALKLAQAMDPLNEALGEQIKGLTFVKNVQSDLVTTLKDSVTAWNDETFAIDGYVRALDTLNAAGPQALKIQEAFVKALTENDLSSGGNLAEAITSMLDKAANTLADSPDLLAPIQDLGTQVLAAFRTALESPSEESINAAMALLTNLTGAINQATIDQADRIKAAGTLTVETFAQAIAGEESKAALGSAGVSLMEALATAMTEGGESAIAKAADLTVRMQDELQKLPEFVRGRLGTDFKTALDAFLADPTQEALDRLRPIIQQINQTLDLIPNNMEDLAPDVVSEIETIIQAFLDLGLTAEEAGARIEAALKRGAEAAKAAADATKAAAKGLSEAQEAKLTEHVTGLVKPTNFVAPASGGGGSRADMFAAAIASMGGWTPALAAAFYEGMQQIADAIAATTAEIFGPPRGTESTSALDPVGAAMGMLRNTGMPTGGSAGAQVAGERQLRQLVMQAMNMGLGAEAQAIEQAYYNGQITLADAIRQLQALLSGGGLRGLAERMAKGGASSFRGGAGRSGGAGGDGSGNAPIVSELQGLRRDNQALRQELISLRHDFREGSIAAYVAPSEVDQAARRGQTDYFIRRF